MNEYDWVVRQMQNPALDAVQHNSGKLSPMRVLILLSGMKCDPMRIF